MPRFIKLPRFTLGSHASIAADVDAEIESHIHERIRQLVIEGMSPEAAHDEARRRFGDLDQTRQSMRGSAMRHERREHRRDFVDILGQDVRYALRQLRRAPGFTAAVAITFGLAIGANSTMFGVLDRLLLRPPAHVRDPESVGRVYVFRPGNAAQSTPGAEVPYVRYAALRDGAARVADVAAMAEDEMPVGTGGAARRIYGGFVSANFWTLVGVHPALGRFFSADEDRPPDGAAVVVLSYSYWRDAFGSDRGVLGKGIDIGARRYTVIGVAPANFNGVKLATTDFWIPVTTLRAQQRGLNADWYTTPNFSWLELVARLHPGVTPAQADAALTAAYAQSFTLTTADTKARPPRAMFGSLLEQRGPQRTPATRVATMLAAVAAIVLLVACANVASLLLARALRRRREIAVRVALGISRGRLMTQLFVESLLLASLGAIVGLGVAYGGGRVMHAVLLPDVHWGEQVFDTRVLLFTAAVTVFAGLLAGLAPALHATRLSPGSALAATARDGSRGRARARAMLLVGQAALSTTLLIGAGLFTRSLQRARSADLGLDTRHLVIVRVQLRDAAPPPGGTSQLYRAFAERLRVVPGITRAATTMQIPFAMSNSTDISVPGVDSVTRLGDFLMNGVGPDYFETMGTRLLRGRALKAEDREGSQLVVVVSEAMAKTVWPKGDALGKCVRVGGGDRPCSEVVGIAANVHQEDVRPEPALQYWFPESQRQGDNSGAFAVVARVAGDPGPMLETIRRTLQPLAPSSAFLIVRPLDDAVERLLQPWRLGATVFVAFGLLGLCIALVGLYSVLAYFVSQRTREIGVRMALGARAPDVLRLVMSEGMRVTAVGLGVGVLIALIAARSVAALLFDVSATDPLVFAVVIATLLTAAATASLIPAWRAARLDPSAALRSE